MVVTKQNLSNLDWLPPKEAAQPGCAAKKVDIGYATYRITPVSSCRRIVRAPVR